MSDGGTGGHELIIIRRHEEEEHASHSSAWKVAHADFMTAMMAFFLIMWLINVTDDEIRKGISQYFNPIHMSQGSSDLKGLNNDGEAEDGKKGPKQPPLPTAPLNPVKLSAGSGEPVGETSGAKAKSVAAEEGSEAKPSESKAATAGGSVSSGTDAAGAGTSAAAATSTTGDARTPGFQDPFAAMAKLAGDPANTAPVSADVVAGDTRRFGVTGGEATRDPFDPVYWQLTPLPPARSANPGVAETMPEVPPGTAPDARTAETVAGAPPARQPAPPPAPAVPPPAPSATAEAPPVAGTSPVMAAAPTVPASPPGPAQPPQSLPPSAETVSGETISAATAIARQMAQQSVQSVMAGAAPELSVRATPEGAVIGLTDDAAYSMFPVGSAVPDAKVVVLMARIAEALATQSGAVVIRGFTDGRPFNTPDNDNWRLSAARARVAYDLLIRGGLTESRVVAIEGHADRSLLNAADPYAAENRRIEILLKAGRR
jgi:chemotaxis protein MotB